MSGWVGPWSPGAFGGSTAALSEIDRALAMIGSAHWISSCAHRHLGDLRAPRDDTVGAVRLRLARRLSAPHPAQDRSKSRYPTMAIARRSFIGGSGLVVAIAVAAITHAANLLARDLTTGVRP